MTRANPVYAGDMAYGKTKKEQVGGKSVFKNRADWGVIKDHHTPIIEREVFEEVNRSRGKSRGKARGEGRRHPLAGLAVCGCCMHCLQFREGRNPYFTCKNRYVTGQEACVDKVNAMFLEQAVLFRMESYLGERHSEAEAADSCQSASQEERAALQQKMEQAQRTYDRLRQEHRESYQSYVLGEQARFHSLRAQMKRQEEVLRELQGQIAKVDEQLRKVKTGAFTEEDTSLTLEMVGRYIDKIVVYGEMDIEIGWKE